MPRAAGLWLTLLLAAVLGAATALSAACGDSGGSPTAPTATSVSGPTSVPTHALAGTLRLTSSAFSDNGAIPIKYSCEGEQVSPPLAIAGPPPGTSSLALTLIDSDVGDFTHWTVWNIAPSTTDVAEGTVPQGAVEGMTGRGTPGYIGPCPPTGSHHYVFTLYALDSTLDLDAASASPDDLLSAVDEHILDKTTLTGTYTKER